LTVLLRDDDFHFQFSYSLRNAERRWIMIEQGGSAMDLRLRAIAGSIRDERPTPFEEGYEQKPSFGEETNTSSDEEKKRKYHFMRNGVPFNHGCH
jgi:hypothetical protein